MSRDHSLRLIFMFSVAIFFAPAVLLLVTSCGSNTTKARMIIPPVRNVIIGSAGLWQGAAPFSVELQISASFGESDPESGFVKFVQIDFGEGAGYVPVELSGYYSGGAYLISVSHTYLNPGEYFPKVRVTYLDEKIIDRNLSINTPITVLPAEDS